QETGQCELAAVSDRHGDTARRVARQLQLNQSGNIAAFETSSDLVNAGIADAAFVASRTEHHEPDTRPFIQAGHRVLLEKPLTDNLKTSIDFARYLSAKPDRSRAVMQAFMRRFDGPLLHAQALLQSGCIGTPFKMVSALEDPLPPPVGYQSPGILRDMAVHNIDETIWLLGRTPEAAYAVGANLYTHRITTVQEDYDDGFLQLWFPGNTIAQIQVSRNHVAGYRNETWIYGEKGLIHVGHFQENPLCVTVEALGPQGPIQRKDFTLRNYGPDVPVFIQRFGPAYKTELAYFVARCLADEPFSVTHEDGLNAMLTAEAGGKSMETLNRVKVEYPS
ncbi:MAG: Gfo/Idh/MocA family oxidoreductase, partial [bacterium]|nr:Gfo/Idh/MocA family oxidoreductase [bacterium]